MLDLFTVVWGKEMTRSYVEVTLPSLMQGGNIPATKEFLHCYNFYASDEAKQNITESRLYRELIDAIEVNWFALQKGEWELTSNVLYQMKLSAKERHHMLAVAPDHALGNGSIFNMAGLVNDQHNPILYVNPRVSEEGYEIIKALLKAEMTIPNRRLVSIAMEWLEQAAYMIEITGRNTWVIRHNVPTPCLLPDEKIIEIFATNPTRYGGYDHLLPYRMIELSYPWYLIKDSDTFFFVERGRHFVHETTLPWDERKQKTALDFFSKQEVIWRGSEERC